MSFAPETHTEAFVKPEALLRVPVGLVSPLWGLFAGAAVSGAAWWWMTRWARIENLEAMLGAATKAVPAADPALAILTAPVPVPVPVAAAVEVAEAVAEPVVEATFEAPPEPSAQTVEAFTEAPLRLNRSAARRRRSRPSLRPSPRKLLRTSRLKRNPPRSRKRPPRPSRPDLARRRGCAYNC